MRGIARWVAACISIHASVASSYRPIERESHKPLKVSTVYQFPEKGSWLENVATRSNGDLLVSRSDVSELWSINPTKGTAVRLYSFPNTTASLGLAEIAPDIFAVVTTIFDHATVTPTPGTSRVWRVDLNQKPPAVRLIKAMPEAKLLNGATVFDRKAGIILLADSQAGAIWRLNTRTGAYSKALSDATMAPLPGGVPIGVNSVRVRGRYVYYTSSTKQLFCRVRVDARASAVGPFRIIAKTNSQFLDDFAFGRDGTAYATTNTGNSVVRIRLDGKVETLVGGLNDTAVAGSTGCEFSRDDKDLLYVITDGALPAPVNGTFTEPGKVVAIRLASGR